MSAERERRDEEREQRHDGLRRRQQEAATRGLERDAELELLRACDLSTSLGWRDCAVISVLLDAGLRPAELCSLALHDMQGDAAIAVRGKDRRERAIRLAHETAATVREYVRSHRRPARGGEQAVFLADDGRPLDVATLGQLVRSAGQRAGFERSHVTPHLLRQTAIARRWASHQRARGQDGKPTEEVDG